MGRPRPGAGMRVKIVLAGLLVVLAGLVGVPLASAEVPPARHLPPRTSPSCTSRADGWSTSTAAW